jgi:hypothetical protein
LLQGESVYIRDGALIGLVSINDPATISTLKQAIQQESIPLLRKLIIEALPLFEAALESRK